MSETIGDILSGGGLFQEAKPPVEATPPVIAPVESPKPVEQTKTPEPVVVPPAPAPAPEPSYKKYGFESEEELTSSLNELKTYRERQAFYSELENDYEQLAKTSDPSSAFANDDEYKIFLTAQKMGQGKDFGVVQKIIRSDLNQMDDLDVLSLKDQYDIPRYAGKDDKAKRAILGDLGIDTSGDFQLDHYKESLSEEQELKLARMAHQAREAFNQGKANVQLPEKVDYKVKIQEKLKQRQDHFNELGQKWNDVSPKIADTMGQIKFVDKNDKGEVVDDFSYDIDQEFRSEIPTYVSNYAMTNNVEPTPENVKGITELLFNAYKVANWDTIMRSARNQARTQVREQLDKERFNGQPINKTEAPPDRKPDEADEINRIAGLLFKR